VIIPVTFWEGMRVMIGRHYRLNVIGKILAATVTAMLPVPSSSPFFGSQAWTRYPPFALPERSKFSY